MANKFKIRVQGTVVELEEGLRYFIEVEDRTFVGIIMEDMNFEHDGIMFFYIFDERDNEDYMIAENEIVNIKKA